MQRGSSRRQEACRFLCAGQRIQGGYDVQLRTLLGRCGRLKKEQRGSEHLSCSTRSSLRSVTAARRPEGCCLAETLFKAFETPVLRILFYACMMPYGCRVGEWTTQQ